MKNINLYIEALIFAAKDPISFEDIRDCLEKTFETSFSEKEIQNALQNLQSRYRSEDSAIELVTIAGGFQFLTKGAYHPIINYHFKLTTKKRLSRAALETLSIVAYKQPVSKAEMEKIRGVNCDYTVQKLLEKELVEILGRSDAPGRPLLYGTSNKFMDYLGIKDLNELPKLKDFKSPENEVGEAAPEEINGNFQTS